MHHQKAERGKGPDARGPNVKEGDVVDAEYVETR
jgi:hypothetical protein